MDPEREVRNVVAVHDMEAHAGSLRGRLLKLRRWNMGLGTFEDGFDGLFRAVRIVK